MANSVFLDTNGWLALLNSGDSRHVEADTVWRDLKRRGVGTPLIATTLVAVALGAIISTS